MERDEGEESTFYFQRFLISAMNCWRASDYSGRAQNEEIINHVKERLHGWKEKKKVQSKLVTSAKKKKKPLFRCAPHYINEMEIQLASGLNRSHSLKCQDSDLTRSDRVTFHWSGVNVVRSTWRWQQLKNKPLTFISKLKVHYVTTDYGCILSQLTFYPLSTRV